MTYWFSRLPGQIAVSNADQDSPDGERLDDHMVIVGADAPDWIEVPAEAPHPDAGQKLRVGNMFMGECLSCHRQCRHYTFEQSDLHVSECTHGCDFIWYQFREETQDDARPSSG